MLARIVFCWCLSVSVSMAGAEVRLPSIFGNQMVIQQGRPVSVWGWAEPGEAVTVTLGESRGSAKADESGRWRVTLPPRDADVDREPLQLTVAGSNTIVLDDVLVGEVWLCGGQSNMQWTVSQSADPAEEIAAADHPKIRLFTVNRVVAQDPATDVTGNWQVCSPQTVGQFSAVGYAFGRQLHQAKDVPVGLVSSNWGGTPAEAWTPRATLEAILPQAVARYTEAREKYPEAAARHEAALAAWQEQVKQAEADGKPAPKKPKAPQDPDKSPHAPGVLYNGMIAPLASFGLRGAIWYQGESNAGRAAEYEGLLTAMIQSWRDNFENPELAFGIVQLANFMAPQTDANDPGGWAHLRDAQRRVAANVPRTGLAVIIDIGEAKDIHPKNKQDVGRRLAAWALHDIYGHEDVVAKGPEFAGMTRRDQALVVTFHHATGLQVKGDRPTGFVIAGDDGKFVFANAAIEGESIVLSHPDVPQPTQARYGWASNPACNLYNGANLPAVPFQATLTSP